MRVPEIGDRFEQKYEITAILGAGGFARVYLATDVAVGREVALKIVEPGLSGVYQESVVARFLREGRVLADLQHQNIVTMFDFGQSEGGLLFMVFEYIKGRELAAVIRQDGEISAAVVAHILDQILSALRTAHEAGVLHRDIKPANIMLYEYGGDPYNAKLLDFGIARPTEQGTSDGITQAGRVVGTPRYMSPEQVFGEQLTPASDVFSLGLVAYEMLTARPAMAGETARELRENQVSAAPIQVPPAVAPPQYRAVIDRMLAREVAQRYGAAADVQRDLRHAARTLHVSTTGIQRDRERHARAHPQSSQPAQPRALLTTDGNGAAAVRRKRLLAGITIGLLTGGALAGYVSRFLGNAEVSNEPAVRTGQLPGEEPRGPTPAPPRPPVQVELEDVSTADASPSGCDAAPKPGTQRIQSTELGRSYFVHVPRSAGPHPVVLMFHRGLADGSHILQTNNFARQAERHGYLAVALNATEQQYAWKAVDTELDAIKPLLAELDATQCVDWTRVFALGEGRGGKFATRLACEFALSGIATTLTGEHRADPACAPQVPTPRLRLYGRNDPYIPVGGGKGCLIWGQPMLSAAEIARGWRSEHGCEGQPKKWLNKPGGTCLTWKCSYAPYMDCATSGGHDWPGAPKASAAVPMCQEEPSKTAAIDYGATILKFFDEFGRDITTPLADE